MLLCAQNKIEINGYNLNNVQEVKPAAVSGIKRGNT
jgi:hypothetical protein